MSVNDLPTTLSFNAFAIVLTSGPSGIIVIVLGEKDRVAAGILSGVVA
tara:strand:- start:176 stop:319 length:144 start_codon:yes stop_codon:yes gene_type:complete